SLQSPLSSKNTNLATTAHEIRRTVIKENTHSYFTKCSDVNGELCISTFLDKKGIVTKMLFLKRNMKVMEIFAPD
ncbi:hypothetical protein RhiirA4_485156, partial [Rhizophagus irregularis]